MRGWPVLLAVMLLLVAPQPALSDGGESGARADLGIYHTYAEMVSELQNLTAAHPDILRLESLGKTYEGRELWAVKLSDNVTADEAEPNMTILGGIHAGELIGVEVALSILLSLVGNYTTNDTIGWYVNSTQLWFVPMMNPDGHVYVEQGNQWRKNRSPNPGGTFGTDLNRNFGHLWGLEASHNPPDDEYCGQHAFSENESRAVSKLVTDHPPDITLSYHAYGQYILYPWGNSINQEPVDKRLPRIAANMSLSMPESDRYLPMMAREMYAASGDTDDYFYMNLSILPFTIELSTSSRPPDSAVPGICADNYGPVLYVLNYTVGAPPPPPPRHSISLAGPASFRCNPFQILELDYTLDNTGEAEEEISICATSMPQNWTYKITPKTIRLSAGKGTTVSLSVDLYRYTPAFSTAEIVLNASAASGADAGARAIGTVDRVQELRLDVVSPSAILAGFNASFSVAISNRGNAWDNASIIARASTGWNITQLPSAIALAPWTINHTSILLKVPPSPDLGATTVNITFDISSLDSSYHGEQSIIVLVQILRSLAILPDAQNVALHENERVTIPITVTNGGNVREKGSLDLTGDGVHASLDRSTLDLPPFSSARVNLTLTGKKGDWTVDVIFVSDAGYPAVRAGVNYTIKARSRPPTAPGYGPVLLVLLAVMVVVVAVAAILWWGSRRGRDDSGGKEAP